jgi:hypothetical protein
VDVGQLTADVLDRFAKGRGLRGRGLRGRGLGSHVISIPLNASSNAAGRPAGQKPAAYKLVRLASSTSSVSARRAASLSSRSYSWVVAKTR